MEHSSALLAKIGRNAQENTREQHSHFGLSAYFRLSRYSCTNALIEWPLDRSFRTALSTWACEQRLGVKVTACCGGELKRLLRFAKWKASVHVIGGSSRLATIDAPGGRDCGEHHGEKETVALAGLI